MSKVCAICGKPFGPADGDDMETREHIFPVALGGDSSPDNITYTHQRCNLLKRTLRLTPGLRLTISICRLLEHKCKGYRVKSIYQSKCSDSWYEIAGNYGFDFTVGHRDGYLELFSNTIAASNFPGKDLVSELNKILEDKSYIPVFSLFSREDNVEDVCAPPKCCATRAPANNVKESVSPRVESVSPRVESVSPRVESLGTGHVHKGKHLLPVLGIVAGVGALLGAVLCNRKSGRVGGMGELFISFREY